MTVRIRAHVARAARDIAPLWPLHSFIALNPLAAQESTAFESAEHPGAALTRSRRAYLQDIAAGRITVSDVRAAICSQIPEVAGAPALRLGAQTRSALDILVTELVTPGLLADDDGVPIAPVSDIDGIVVKWLAAYLDPDPAWPMPRRSQGLYAAWRELASHDTGLPRSARRRLRSLPATAEACLIESLRELGIDPAAAEAVLCRELAYVPGWVGYIKWREEYLGDVDLLDVLALRFALRGALGCEPEPAPQKSEPEPVDEVRQRAEALAGKLGADPHPHTLAALTRVLGLHPAAQHRFTLQHAYELHYRRHLIAKLPASPAAPQEVHTQFIACIDPRSEGIRRHLEQHNPGIETLGFAGFFGVPFRFSSYQSADAIDALPALLTPRHRVTETTTAHAAGNRWVARMRARRALAAGFHAAETSPAAPYALAELSGPVMGVLTACKTLAPASTERWSARLRHAWAAKPDTQLTMTDAFSLEERVGLAEASLRTMGLGRFAPLVVIAGHGSTSANNLYQSAQHCGACGGNRGDANARAAAALFNDPQVRQALGARGLVIPAGTHFVAAEHDTVTDHLEILDPHLIPASHRSLVQQFVAASRQASDALVRERAAQLPGVTRRRTVEKVRARSADWAEVYPEWGLAGNAAIVVGPREMTVDAHLDRRVFLHSYRPELDPTGAGLETILTAPVIVAQWINHQYYFSAINPDTLGAGTKTTHNAIGTLGVLSGHGGDLRRGLPWQSIGLGTRLVHEPMRLAVIVQAPLERVTEIIDRNSVLRSLVMNRWISVTARSDAQSPWLHFGAYGWEAPAWLDSDQPAPVHQRVQQPVQPPVITVPDRVKEDSHV